jgi:hypothetical protein
MTDRAIISIPIDSKNFEKFLTLFNQYDEKLSEQPAAWKKLSDAIASTGQKMSVPAAKVSGHFSDTADSSSDIAKSLSASTKAMQELFSATQKSNAAMSSLMTSTKGVSKGLFDAGAGLLGVKKTIGLLGAIPGFGAAIRIAGLGAAAAGALGDMALHSAGSVSSNARAAFGANASYGQFQNANSQLGQLLSNPGANLQNIAAAQWNPAAAGALGLFGVTSRQSSSQALATILRSSVGTLRATHNLALPQVTYAESLAGLSPTDMITMANDPKKDFNATLANMLDPKLIAAQNVSGPVISSDQKTAVSWATSMNIASAKFASTLSLLNQWSRASGKMWRSLQGQ